jgi:hypothetical protein
LFSISKVFLLIADVTVNFVKKEESRNFLKKTNLWSDLSRISSHRFLCSPFLDLFLIGDVTISFVIKRRKQSMEAFYLEHLYIPFFVLHF